MGSRSRYDEDIVLAAVDRERFFLRRQGSRGPLQAFLCAFWRDLSVRDRRTDRGRRLSRGPAQCERTLEASAGVRRRERLALTGDGFDCCSRVRVELRADYHAQPMARHEGLPWPKTRTGAGHSMPRILGNRPWATCSETRAIERTRGYRPAIASKVHLFARNPLGRRGQEAGSEL